jgi:predicted anti-sigma-YlaC factor YlaD
MLSCAEFLAEFGDYVEQASSPQVRARLEEHLQECKTCQVIVDSTRKTIQILTDSQSFTLPADNVEPIVQTVMARIRSKQK